MQTHGLVNCSACPRRKRRLVGTRSRGQSQGRHGHGHARQGLLRGRGLPGDGLPDSHQGLGANIPRRRHPGAACGAEGGGHVGSGGTVLARLRNWVAGAEVSLWWDTHSIRYRGRVEELDPVPWRDGSSVFEKEYASTWHSSPAVRTQCDCLRVIAAAIWAAVADYAARHPEAYAASWRADEGEQKEPHAVGRVAPPTPAAVPPKQGGGGAGFGWLALVVLIIGGLFLYQREGGARSSRRRSASRSSRPSSASRRRSTPGFGPTTCSSPTSTTTASSRTAAA